MLLLHVVLASVCIHTEKNGDEKKFERGGVSADDPDRVPLSWGLAKFSLTHSSAFISTLRHLATSANVAQKGSRFCAL